MVPYPEYFKSLPKKPSGSGVLFFDEEGRVLLLKTTYKDGWLWPGGMVDAGESPVQACIRECKEELGLELSIGKLLCLDYKIAANPELKDDSFQFIFDGGVLSREQIDSIVLDSKEHSQYSFVSTDEAIRLLNSSLSKRLPYCLEARKIDSFVYLEGGNPI